MNGGQQSFTYDQLFKQLIIHESSSHYILTDHQLLVNHVSDKDSTF